MPVYRVSVGSAEYEVTAPDENTAWQWANMTHAQARTPAPTPTPTPAQPAAGEQSWGDWLGDIAYRGTVGLPVELYRGAQRGLTTVSGIPGQLESQLVAPGVSERQRVLNAFDAVDRGEYTPPERLSEPMQAYLRGQQYMYGAPETDAPGVETSEERAARAYAAASPQERQRMRQQYTGMLTRDTARIGELAQDATARAARRQEFAPRVSQFSDIRSPLEAAEWLTGAAGEAAPQLGVVMGTAALTRNPLAVAGVSGAMAFGEGTENRIAYVMEQTADLPPGQQATAIAQYLEDTRDTTAMVAIAQGALDNFGPVGTILKRRFISELGEEVVARTAGEAFRQGVRRAPGEIAEEALTGGAQEVIAIAGERALGEQQGDVLTSDNFFRVLNAAAAEGAGGVGGSAVITGIDAARAARTARAARSATLGDADPDRTTPVDLEYQRIVSDEVVAAMDADPTLTQRKAVEQVLRNAGDLYQRAVDNVEGAATDETATAGTGLDDDAGLGAGAPPTGGPGTSGTGTTESGETVAGGLGESDTSVPVSDAGTTAGESALAATQFDVATLPIYEATTIKDRKVAAKPIITSIIDANYGDLIVPGKVVGVIATRMAQSAARKEVFDPAEVVQSVLVENGLVAASAETAAMGERPGTQRTVTTINGETVVQEGPTATAPTAVEEELAARDQEISQELVAPPEGEPVPTVAETATVEKVTPEPEVFVDNPGGEWLLRKQQRAEEDRAEAFANGETIGSTARMVDGPTTQTIRRVEIPVEKLRTLEGVRGEQPAPGEPKYDALRESVDKNGFDREKAGLPMVFVNHEGEAFLYEGNNRVAVAAEEGVKSLPVEVQYANGAEAVPGPFAPDQILAEHKALTSTQAAPTAVDEELASRELSMIDEELSLISEQRAENAYEGEDPDTMADYEERIAELLARRKQLAAPEQTKVSRNAEGSVVGGTEVDINAFRGRTLGELLDHIATNLEGKYSAFDMRLADRLNDLLFKLQEAGFDVTLHVLQKGDPAPSSIAQGSARGTASINLRTRKVDVYLRSPDLGLSSSGGSTEIILHEALHAVSMGIFLAVRRGQGTPEMVKFRKDMNDLRNKVIDHFNARVKSVGKEGLNPFERAMYTGGNNAFADLDEFLTWGLTNEQAQDYLRSIEIGPRKSLFDKFIDAFRLLLGIDPGDTSALAHLVDIVSPLFDMTAQDYRKTIIEEAGGAATTTAAMEDLTATPRNTDISALIQGLPETERVNVRARLDRIMANYAKDEDVDRLLGSLEALREDVERRIDRDREKRTRGRVRGYERAMEVIYRAERTGQLTPESAGLLRWLLEQNPAIADELALSFREAKADSPAGQYNPAARLATIFSGANEGTPVHEVLHHTERLLPERVRNGIRAAWMKRIQDLIRLAEQTNNTNMREVLGTIVQAYYGDTKAQKALKESFESRDIPFSLYHLSNPSEFWAVNATDLVGKRAKMTGWTGAARNWIEGFIEKVKDLFGLTNNSAIITGLKAVLKAESGVISGKMLSDKSGEFLIYAGKAAHGANRSRLDEAKAMEAAGALSGPTGTTRVKTGWFRGVDDEWRFEINDRDMKFKEGYTPDKLKVGRTYLLGQIIDHPKLFEQYPDLQKINVVVSDAAGDAGGHWDASRNEIVISDRAVKEVSNYLDTLVHEVQHAVQTWEGFASGAHYKKYPLSLDAINKALSFLSKNNGQPLFMWGRSYGRNELRGMQERLEFIRSKYGDQLQQDNDFLRSFAARRTEIATERRGRTSSAEDAWRNGNHPEAVRFRELRDARIAAATRMNDYTLTPEERQVARAEYEVAQKAESAQYKYVEGMIATGVVPLPDMRDLDSADDYLLAKREEVLARRDRANSSLSAVGVDKLMYYLTAGEVEARDAEQRREKLDEEREATPPYVGEPFGSPSDMITVNPYTSTSASPPKRKPVKLTPAQIKLAFQKADAQRNKLNRIQKRISSTNKAEDLLEGGIEMTKLVRGDKRNIALLRGALDTLNTTKWRSILPALSTEDIFRILKDRIPGLNRADDLIRKELQRFDATENLALAKELETIAKFFKKFPKAVRVFADIQFATVANQVDPSLAPDAETYVAKVDKPSKELRDKLAATQDPKEKKDIQTELDKRFREVESVYKGAPNADDPVYGYNALSRPEFGGNKGRAIFAMIRDAHRNDLMRTYAAHQQHIRDTQDPDEVDAALEKLAAAFKPALDQVIYFPLMRFGDYYARVGDGPNSVFKMFETETKLNQYIRLMEDTPTPVTDTGNVADLREGFAKSADAPIKDVLKLFEQKGETVANLRNQVFDIWLQTMSSGDMRQHMAKRSLRAGYSTDILKNYANFRSSSISNLKRAKFTHKLEMALEEAEASAKGMPDRRKWEVFAKEIRLRATASLSPPARDDTKIDKAITLGNRAAFFQYLAQPKVGFIQLTQLHVVALSMLAQKYGHAKATAALGKYAFSALGGFAASPLTSIRKEDGEWAFDWQQPNLLDNPVSTLKAESDPEMYEVLVEGWNEGRDINLFMDTFAQDIGGFGKSDPQQRGIIQELMKGRVDRAAWRGTKFAFNSMGTLMHQMERVNREATYMAALELAYRERRKDGMPHEQAKAEAIDEATTLTLEATFDFSAYNKPRILTTRGGRVAGQFYTFPYMLSSLFIRKAFTTLKLAKLEPGERAAAAEILTGTSINLMLYAGITGLPLYGIATTVASMLLWLFDDEDDEEEGGLSYIDEEGNLKATYNVDWWFRNVWIPKFFGVDGTAQNLLGYDDATAEMAVLAAEKGPISALTDIDLANSVALDFLFFVPETPRAETPEGAVAETAFNFFGGATAGVIMDYARAAYDFGRGYTDRAMEKLPKLVGNVAKAMRFAEEGQRTYAGPVIGMPRDFWTNDKLVLQALGFNSTAADVRLRGNYDAIEVNLGVARARETALEKFRNAVRNIAVSSTGPTETNIAAYNAAEEAVSEYNQRYPFDPIAPETLNEVQTGVIERILDSEETGGLPYSWEGKTPYLDDVLRRRLQAEDRE